MTLIFLILFGTLRGGTATCSTAEGKYFINVCSDLNLSRIAFEPVRITASNTLDLVFTTNPPIISSFHFLPGLSGRRIVHFTCAFQPQHPQRSTKTIKDYVKADFVSIFAESEVFTGHYMECASDRSVE